MTGGDPVGSPDIILVWPLGRDVPDVAPVPGYTVDVLPPERDEWWIDIHRRAVPSFGRDDLAGWLERYRRLAPADGVLVATDDATGEPVATAGSVASSGHVVFPDLGQLAWVATVPQHRGRGLATWLSALATARLARDGHRRIFLCTGDDLTAAIRVYLRLGYLPCLYASDQPARWERLCAAIGTPFTPDDWPTPAAYLDRKRGHSSFLDADRKRGMSPF
jgi:mycothiol synthase